MTFTNCLRYSKLFLLLGTSIIDIQSLVLSHIAVTDDLTFVGTPGFMKWTPDGTVLGMSWEGGGVSLWSVFGSLLTVSLRWDYTHHPQSHALTITNMVSVSQVRAVCQNIGMVWMVIMTCMMALFKYMEELYLTTIP